MPSVHRSVRNEVCDTGKRNRGDTHSRSKPIRTDPSSPVPTNNRKQPVGDIGGFLTKAPRRSIEERNELAEKNVALAHKFVASIYKNLPYLSLYRTFEEALSDAYMGLLRACEMFDPDKGKISTYAYVWMRQSLQRSREEQELLYYPEGKRSSDRKRIICNLDENCQFIVDGVDSHQEKEAEEIELRKAVQQALRKIPKRQAMIIQLRLEGFRLQEIGEQLSLTRERIRQIEKQARESLRKHLWQLQGEVL